MGLSNLVSARASEGFGASEGWGLALRALGSLRSVVQDARMHAGADAHMAAFWHNLPDHAGRHQSQQTSTRPLSPA